MGFEYKIAFDVPEPKEMQETLDQVWTPESNEHCTAAIEIDGFYFCDRAKSDVSSRIFRRLIDKALHYSKVVIHEL